MPVLATEQKFGVFSPIMGLREDIPSVLLPNVYSQESENVIIRHGEAQRMRMRIKELLDSNSDQVQTPDANPVIKYHLHDKQPDDIQYLFAYTKDHVYYWNTSTLAFDLKFTCASSCTHWSVASFNGYVISTNNVDLIQVWNDASPGSTFTDLGSASGLLVGTTTYCTAAKYVVSYENYVIFGAVTEGGTFYASSIIWSSIGDHTDYNRDGSGDTGTAYIYGADHIMGFGKYGTTFEYLIIFKKKSIYRMWLITGDTVFSMAPIKENVGLLATDSVIKDADGNLYFIATDYTVREIKQGIISQAIDKTIKQINYTYEAYIAGGYIAEYNKLWWSLPYGDSATGNDKIISYDPTLKLWETVDCAVRAFGNFNRQTVYTIDSIPYDSIDEIGWPAIDTVENIVGFPLDLASDYSGYTWDLHSAVVDAGSDYTGKLVFSADLTNKRALHLYKRLFHMQHYFRREGTGDVTISVKEDTAYNWEVIGSVDLTSDDAEEILVLNQACDLRAKNFLVKISATNQFSYLGTVFSFSFDGEF